MKELIEKLKREFLDEETRHIYCDEFLNGYIATQIKVLREQRRLTQAALGQRANMRPERISVLEDVNYSSWTLHVLRRLARALDLRLSVKFETFGSFLPEFEGFDRDALERLSFKDDPAFHQPPAMADGVEEREGGIEAAWTNTTQDAAHEGKILPFPLDRGGANMQAQGDSEQPRKSP